MIEVVEHEGKPAISVVTKDGPRIFTEYKKFQNAKEFAKEVTKIIPYKDMKSYWAEVNACIEDSAARAYKHFNKLAFKVFIAPIKEKKHYIHFCFKSKRIDMLRLAKVQKAEAILDQVEKDGIYHIAPFVYKTATTPAQLKEHFGKGKWKKLCKNSFWRNKLITQFGKIDEKEIYEDIPSSLLKQRMLKEFNVEVLQWLTKSFKGKWNEQNLIFRNAISYRDTKRMLEEEGLTFNRNWTPAKVHEEHEAAVVRSNQRWLQRRAAQVPYQGNFNQQEYGEFKKAKLLHKNNLTKFEYQNCNATLLMTADEIKQEGVDMHHCVGSYARSASNDQYFVFSICQEGKKYSTLGVRVTDGICTLEQHYKHCNAKVDDPVAIELARVVVSRINQFKENKDGK